MKNGFATLKLLAQSVVGPVELGFEMSDVRVSTLIPLRLKFAITVTADTARTFRLPRVQVIESAPNNDGTTTFIVETQKDLRWELAAVPGYLSIEPL